MTESFVFACVKWGEQYSAYYVNALYDMVRRNVPHNFAYTFECFTDDPAELHSSITVKTLPGDLTGWWNKLYLFKEGVFAPDQRILYFDLDTLIFGLLDSVLNYKGDFALLRDFYRAQGYGSGVMLWRAKACYHIWSRFEKEGKPTLVGGDQAWIEIAYPNADRLQDFFPGVFASYKTDCHPLPSQSVSVVCFHGEPKQDNCGATWVRALWKVGGVNRVNADTIYPTIEEELLANAQHAAKLSYPRLQQVPAHERCAVIIGGGATLEECKQELLQHMEDGHDFLAINNAPQWLTQNGLKCDIHVLCGTEKEHVAFVTENKTLPCYIASTSHPAVFEKAAKQNITLWHPEMDQLAVALKDTEEKIEWVKGGESTGLRAMYLAYLLGYRSFHLYGFDSSFYQRAHHAYAQPASDRDRVFTADLYGRQFHVCAWMLKQANEFVPLASTLLSQGCSVAIHGDGLLHCMATHIQSAT